MHRARWHSSAASNYNWYHPIIRFVKVPRRLLDLRGPFEHITRPLISKALESGGESLIHDDFVYMPVHELQISNIVKMFPSVEVLPAEVSLKAQAQTSIRRV